MKLLHAETVFGKPFSHEFFVYTLNISLLLMVSSVIVILDVLELCHKKFPCNSIFQGLNGKKNYLHTLCMVHILHLMQILARQKKLKLF